MAVAVGAGVSVSVGVGAGVSVSVAVGEAVGVGVFAARVLVTVGVDVGVGVHIKMFASLIRGETPMLIRSGASCTVLHSARQRGRILNFQQGVYALLDGYPSVFVAATRF